MNQNVINDFDVKGFLIKYYGIMLLHLCKKIKVLKECKLQKIFPNALKKKAKYTLKTLCMI